MNKTKFLLLGQIPPPYGGQNIHIGKIVEILERNNFDHFLINMSFSSEMDEMGKIRLTKFFKLFYLLIKMLMSVILYKPDYIYYPPSGCEKIPVYRDMIFLFFVRLFRKKTIYHFHAGGISELYPKLGVISKKLFKFAFNKPDVAICMSNSGKKDPLFLDSKEIKLIPYGVEDYSQNNHNGYEKSAENFIILFVGVCRESKGILNFIKIIEEANKKDSRITGVIIGKIYGEKEEKEIKLAINKGFIQYSGIKIGDEKIKLYLESNLFLFPTFFEHENFPTVILEAFSAALPVISSKWRGIPDQIIDDFNGYIFNYDDWKGMSNKINELANNPKQMALLSENARNTFLKHYTEILFEKNILELFREL